MIWILFLLTLSSTFSLTPKSRVGTLRELLDKFSMCEPKGSVLPKIASLSEIWPTMKEDIQSKLKDSEKIDNPQTFLFIGGGPVGLRFANLAILYGHHVILVEKREFYTRDRFLDKMGVLQSFFGEYFTGKIPNLEDQYLEYTGYEYIAIIKHIEEFLFTILECFREKYPQRVSIYRPCKCLEVEISDGRPVISCKYEKGEKEFALTGDILFGCDGAHSLIREKTSMFIRRKRVVQREISDYMNIYFYKYNTDKILELSMHAILTLNNNEWMFDQAIVEAIEEDRLPDSSNNTQSLEEDTKDRLREGEFSQRRVSSKDSEVIGPLEFLHQYVVHYQEIPAEGGKPIILMGDSRATFIPAGALATWVSLRRAWKVFCSAVATEKVRIKREATLWLNSEIDKKIQGSRKYTTLQPLEQLMGKIIEEELTKGIDLGALRKIVGKGFERCYQRGYLIPFDNLNQGYYDRARRQIVLIGKGRKEVAYSYYQKEEDKCWEAIKTYLQGKSRRNILDVGFHLNNGSLSKGFCELNKSQNA